MLYHIYLFTYTWACVCVHIEFYIHKEEISAIGKNMNKDREYYPKLGPKNTLGSNLSVVSKNSQT